MSCQISFFLGFYKNSAGNIILEDGRREFLPSEETIFEAFTGSYLACGTLLKGRNKIDWKNCNNPDPTKIRHYLCEYKGK